MLSSPQIFMSRKTSFVLQTKKQFGSKEGDLITLLNIFKIFSKLGEGNKKRFCYDYNLNFKALQQAAARARKLTELVKYFGFQIFSSDEDVENVLRCFVSGFFLNVARRNPNGTYSPLSESRKPNHADRLELHLEAGSILTVDYPQYILYYSVYETKDKKRYMKHASEIFPEWLLDLVPDYFSNYSKEVLEKRRQEELERLDQIEAPVQMKTETEVKQSRLFIFFNIKKRFSSSRREVAGRSCSMTGIKSVLRERKKLVRLVLGLRRKKI
jgi:hypothetical protein